MHCTCQVNQFHNCRKRDAQIHAPNGAQVGEQLNERIFLRFDYVPSVFVKALRNGFSKYSLFSPDAFFPRLERPPDAPEASEEKRGYMYRVRHKYVPFRVLPIRKQIAETSPTISADG
jgi:hypothetical protein